MTKVVQLSDEAYGLLRGLKRPDESFSDVVLRIGRRGDLRELRQVISPREARAMARSIKEIDELDRA